MYTILIVDGSTVSLRTVSAQLRKAGFAAVPAETIGRGRSRLAAGSIDLVILDPAVRDLSAGRDFPTVRDFPGARDAIGLPDGDGLAFLRELRRSRSYRDLPVVVLTASGSEADRAEARAAGATAFLTKPVSTTELCQTVTRALAIAGYAGQPAGPHVGHAPAMW